MDTSKIASAVALDAAPVVLLKTAIDGGLPVTAADVKSAWSNVLRKFGCEGWIPVSSFIRAHNRHAAELESLEKLLADTVKGMTQDADAGGYQEVSELGTTYVSSKSACRNCPDEMRLAGLTMLARVAKVLKSRRNASTKI